MNYFLYLGSFMNPQACQRTKSCPFSANRFQLEFLTNFLNHDSTLSVIAICPKPTISYPSENLICSNEKEIIGKNIVLISPFYLNYGMFKVLSIIFSVIVTMLFVFIKEGLPKFILVYNPYVGYAVPGLFLSKLLKLNSFCIVADMPPRSGWSTKGILRQLEAAIQRWCVSQFDALLPFSNHIIHDLNFQRPYLRIDPGIYEKDFPEIQSIHDPQNVLLFTGVLSKQNGVGFLLEAFKKVTDPNILLWITGRGELENMVMKLSNEDSRIIYKGFISHEELLVLMQQAKVLINPRQSTLPEHKYNFPSKIIEYMATGRPVISTCCSDIEEEYANYLILIKHETPEIVAKIIEYTFSMSENDLKKLGSEGRDFVMAQKTWGRISKTAFLFINKFIETSKCEY